MASTEVRMSRIQFLVAVSVGWLAAEVPVHAYLDPGSGSMLLQVLLGGFAAVGVIGKLYWNRLNSFFRSGDKTDQPADPPNGS